MKQFILIITLTLTLITPAHAFVIINEIYADPATDLSGDANNDGVRSATQDEFIELLNDGPDTVDISGWKLNDASSLRHTFVSNTTLLPYEYIVVFGGGDPNLYDIKWQKASTGTLNLNNTNETVTLFNSGAQVVDQVSYTTLANNDQSIVRNPQTASGTFVLHTVAASNNADLFSPGTNIDGEPFSQFSPVSTVSQVITTPELPACLYFLIVMVGWAIFNISTVVSLRGHRPKQSFMDCFASLATTNKIGRIEHA